MKKTIITIFGGNSTEREISLITGVAVAKGIFEAGFKSYLIDTISPENIIEISNSNLKTISTKDFFSNQEINNLDVNEEKLIYSIKKINPFKVFIGLHGSEGENGHVQSLFDKNDIKYCGSGAKSSAIGMDKNISKILAKEVDIPIADWVIVSELLRIKYADNISDISKEVFTSILKEEIIENYGFPVVIKANSQGSSVGVQILQSEKDLDDTLNMIDDIEDDFMIEKYIKGREFSVPIIKGEVFPIIEIIPNEGFYDYEHKYSEGKTEHICPAVLAKEQEYEMGDFALKIFNHVGCEEYGRVDFILDERDSKFYFLELNTLPGFTELSLVPESALVKGYKFHELLKYLLDE